MSLFLNKEELEDLTGYKRGADQARWLRSKGYYVEVNALGIPRITQNQIDEKRRIDHIQTPAVKIENTEPNVVAFRAKLSKQV